MGYDAVIGAVLVGGVIEGLLGLFAKYWRGIISPIVSACVVTAPVASRMKTATIPGLAYIHTGGTAYLSGLIKCGECGHNLAGVSSSGNNRDGTKQAKYRCNYRQKNCADACHVKPLNKKYIEGAVQHYITSLCTGDNFRMVMDALNEYAESQSDTDTELETVLWALRNMREAVTNPRTEDDLIRLYEKFIDSVELFEGYVTVALKILPIMGIRRKIHVSAHKKKSPLDYGQMGAWNFCWIRKRYFEACGCGAAEESIYKGVDAVEPASSNSPPDCCIWFVRFPSDKFHTKINDHPCGWSFILVELRGHPRLSSSLFGGL